MPDTEGPEKQNNGSNEIEEKASNNVEKPSFKAKLLFNIN